MLLLGKRRSKLVAFVLAFLHWVFNDGCSCCNAEDDDNNIRFIQLQGRVHERYPATAAAFGDPLTSQNKIYNLMLPPEDPWLCEFPQRYIPFMNNQTARETFDRDYPLPVALFISINRCSAEQKARVASLIQRHIASSLQLLVVYTPTLDSNDRIQFQPDDASLPLDPDLENIGVLHVGYRSAVRIENGMRRAWTGNSARFLLSDNRLWSYPVQILNGIDDEDFYDDYGNANNNNPSDIYWFRIILFTLLVTSPFCRACYLWYAGGGRFYFRRNEDGRINGIQYIPPTPTWLTGRIIGNNEAASNRPAGTLTEEQFNSLPEIEYQPSPSHYDEDNPELNIDDEKLTDEGQKQRSDEATVIYASEDSPVVSHQNSVGVASGEDSAKDDGTIPPNQSSLAPEAVVVDENGDSCSDQSTTEECNGRHDIENNAEHDRIKILDAIPIEKMEKGVALEEKDLSVDPSEQYRCSEGALVCRSAMCSICIDDFEQGEKIVLLPRCQHGFHKECIHPWLTGRQGCCPYCKVDVLGNDNDTAINDSENGTSDVEVASPGDNSAAEAAPSEDEEGLPQDEVTPRPQDEVIPELSSNNIQVRTDPPSGQQDQNV